jgi:hypothetical protein
MQVFNLLSIDSLVIQPFEKIKVKMQRREKKEKEK